MDDINAKNLTNQSGIAMPGEETLKNSPLRHGDEGSEQLEQKPAAVGTHEVAAVESPEPVASADKIAENHCDAPVVSRGVTLDSDPCEEENVRSRDPELPGIGGEEEAPAAGDAAENDAATGNIGAAENENADAPVPENVDESAPPNPVIPTLLEQIGGDVRAFLEDSNRQERQTPNSGNNNCGFDSIIANVEHATRNNPQLEIAILREKTQLPDGTMFDSSHAQEIADHYNGPVAIINRSGEQMEYAIPGLDRLIVLKNSERPDLLKNSVEFLSAYVAGSGESEQIAATVDAIIAKIAAFVPAEFDIRNSQTIDVLIALQRSERTIVLIHDADHFTPAVCENRGDWNGQINRRNRRQQEPDSGDNPSDGGESSVPIVPNEKRHSIPYVHSHGNASHSQRPHPPRPQPKK
jgi:hypothetical protein